MKTSQIIICVVIGIAILAGIGYGLTRSADAPTQEPKVRIGYLPVVLDLPLLIAQDQTFFEARGINYEIIPLSSSNEAYDALVRGDIDLVAGISYLPIFLNNAKQPGVIKLFRPTDFKVGDQYDVMLVKKDSAIKTIKELAGKNIGVYPGTTLQNFTKYYLTREGVDLSQTTFTQLPPANLLPALEAGSIDVAIAYQPNATIALESGAYRALDHDIYAKSFDHSPIGGSAIRSTFVEAHPELAKRVVEAIDASVTYSKEKPSESRAILAKALKIDPAIAQHVPLPEYQSGYDSAVVQQLLNFLVQIGELKEPVDANSLRY